YNCLPGDCPNAVAFGLGTAGGDGDNGNGNGAIGDLNNDSPTCNHGGPTPPYDEMQYFWMHLHNANLISDSIAALNCGGIILITGSSPPTKLRAASHNGPAGWWIVHRSWNTSAGQACAPDTGSVHALWITGDI